MIHECVFMEALEREALKPEDFGFSYFGTGDFRIRKSQLDRTEEIKLSFHPLEKIWDVRKVVTVPDHDLRLQTEASMEIPDIDRAETLFKELGLPDDPDPAPEAPYVSRKNLDLIRGRTEANQGRVDL